MKANLMKRMRLLIDVSAAVVQLMMPKPSLALERFKAILPVPLLISILAAASSQAEVGSYVRVTGRRPPSGQCPPNGIQCKFRRCSFLPVIK